MSEQRTLAAPAPWVQLSVTDEDWDAADPALLAALRAEKVIG